VLLHPPSLAPDLAASYGGISRRSGEAAKADNHSDISPLETNDYSRLSHTTAMPERFLK
jgi:hypothetical protein